MNSEKLKAKVSIPAIFVLYLAIPAFIFLPTIIPTIILNVKYQLKKAAVDVVTNVTGLPPVDSIQGEINDITSDITSAADEGTGGCLTSARNFMVTMTSILLIVWGFWCVVMTFKHFNNKLSIDGETVNCSSGRNKLTTSLNKINNVFMEQSIWGKLLNYGNITISAQNGSVTVKNINNPNKYADVLKSEIS